MVTPTQLRIYQFIDNFFKKHGYAPSLTEIAKGIGIAAKSKSLVSRYVQALRQAGMLDFTEKGHRRIRLIAPKDTVPLLGHIAAGRPIEVIPQEEKLELTQMLLGKNRYALTVKGNSMVDEGILDGDIIICEKRDTADNGDIVVALIDQKEATLKKIHYTKDKKIALIPANNALKPMVYSPSRVQIQGVLVGLIRLPRH